MCAASVAIAEPACCRRGRRLSLILLAAVLMLGTSSAQSRLVAAPSDGEVIGVKGAKSGSVDDDVQARPKRKPTLLPAAQRRTRSSTSPPLTREEPSAPRPARQVTTPMPLPPAYDPPGDRGPPLGTPPHLDPRLRPAGPPIGYPPLPPARQVPGETGIPLGPGPLSPVR